NEENEDVIKLHILLTSNLNIRVELDEVKAFHDTLESDGYVQIDKYLFFYDHGEDRLKEMAEENLTEDLEDVD
ncbi:MAG TPA: hypothetical protein GX731_01965, partial [Clostridiales bacterium]|nr:hypothetical protein [Clostridiales bacterium]